MFLIFYLLTELKKNSVLPSLQKIKKIEIFEKKKFT